MYQWLEREIIFNYLANKSLSIVNKLLSLRKNLACVSVMSETKEVELQDLLPSNVRENFDEAKLRELASTITSKGVLQPLKVKPKGDKYEVIFGERRRRAAELAGLKNVPVEIIRKPLKNDEIIEMQLIENLQREDFTPLEKAKLFKKFMKMGRTEREIAQHVGVTKAMVSQVMSILKLGQTVQTRVVETRRGRPRAFGQLGLYQSYVIVAHTKDKKLQKRIVKAVVDNNFNQMQTRKFLNILKRNPSLSIDKAVEAVGGKSAAKKAAAGTWITLNLPKKTAKQVEKWAEERKIENLSDAIIHILKECFTHQGPIAR